jgi:ribonuclease HIII
MANSVAWTEQLFSTLNDGAVWALPRSGTRVLVYPSKKEVIIIEGLLPEKLAAVRHQGYGVAGQWRERS